MSSTDDMDRHRFDYHTLVTRAAKVAPQGVPGEGPVVVGVSDRPGSRGTNREAVAFAAKLASRAGAEIVVVHALTRRVELIRDLLTVAFTPWRRHLRQSLVRDWSGPLDEAGVAYRVLLVERPVASALIGVAKHCHASRIIVGAPHFGQRRILAASLAEHLRRAAPCPVTTVPAGPADDSPASMAAAVVDGVAEEATPGDAS